MARKKYAKLIFLIPILWSYGLLPFVNVIKPYIFGFPFFMVWMMMSIVLTIICLNWYHYYGDRAA